ncbi:class I SAM-dependent methyltransferase [Streptomyces sp. NPDC059355]|uniref:class I SAM-dependent methyltransferase n=1 Tax=Streptomyces sp. NPDC059355 TaxID=3346811 RepID=UPI0036AB24B9
MRSTDVPRPFNAHMHRVVEPVAALPAGSRVLDAGCGSGSVARWLAEHAGHHVLGIDVELAAGLATDGGEPLPGGGSVELRRADLLSLAQDRPFDAVLLLGVLHYAGGPDMVHRMLLAADALTAPGGPLAVSWICDEVPLTYEEAYLPSRTLVGDALAGLGRGPREVWHRDLTHAHGGSPEHEHRIVYGVWQRG